MRQSCGRDRKAIRFPRWYRQVAPTAREGDERGRGRRCTQRTMTRFGTGVLGPPALLREILPPSVEGMIHRYMLTSVREVRWRREGDATD